MIRREQNYERYFIMCYSSVTSSIKILICYNKYFIHRFLFTVNCHSYPASFVPNFLFAFLTFVK